MATAATPSTPDFKPAFTRVQQSNDFDDAFACVAILTGKTLDEVRKVAIEKLKHPKHGPYQITDAFLNKLLGLFDLISTDYKPLRDGIAQLAPDVAILWIGCDPANENVGRHVVFHRARTTNGAVEYVIDPAYWVTDPAMQIRTDLKALGASWWIGVHSAHPGK